MGIAEFIKKLFAKKPELLPEVTSVELSEITPWLEDKEKANLEQGNKSLEKIKSDFNAEKDSAEQNLQLLAKAELKNPNIPPRIKDVMGGNRAQYIQKVRQLLGKTKIPDDFRQLNSFCRSIEDDLIAFGKSTVKNNAVMQEFFFCETREVAKNIQELALLAKKVNDLFNDSKIEEIEELRQQITEFSVKIERKSQLEQDIKSKSEELSFAAEQLKQSENNLQKAKTSDEFMKFLELSEKKEKSEAELIELKQQILRKFSAIEPALKKYERASIEGELIKNYLEDASSALLEDENFKILHVLAGMKILIEKNKLELKEKKKEKVLQELDSIDEELFNSFLSDCKTAKFDLQRIEQEIAKMNISQKIDELEEQISKQEKDIAKANRIQLEMQEEFEDINLDQLKKELEQKISYYLGEDLHINLSLHNLSTSILHSKQGVGH